MTKYEMKKQKARGLAIMFQTQLDSEISHSWEWCIRKSSLFEKIGKKYGLLREFRENGIL